MSNQCVSFSTDNTALIDIINQQTSKHSLIVVLVRDLVLTSLRHVFRAFHVPGADTTPADFSFSDDRIQECLPRCRPRTNSSTQDPSPDEVVDMLRELLHSLLSEMSQKLYSHAWVVSTEFYQHYQTVHVNLLVSTACIAFFISFPWPKGLAPATIHSYLSALTYVHKIQGH